MLVAEIERQRQRDLIAALDAGERLVAESLGDLLTLTPPELDPGDQQLLQPWLTWCRDKSVRHAPAKPWSVAAYVLDRYRGNIVEEQIFTELAAIQRLHDKFGLASPVCTAPVQTALEKIAVLEHARKIDAGEKSPTPNFAPRSWTKDAQRAFWSLPPFIKAAVGRREAERETYVRRLQNEVAAMKHKSDTATKPVTTEKEKVNP